MSLQQQEDYAVKAWKRLSPEEKKGVMAAMDGEENNAMNCFRGAIYKELRSIFDNDAITVLEISQIQALILPPNLYYQQGVTTKESLRPYMQQVILSSMKEGQQQA
jgi:hypothetical protein